MASILITGGTGLIGSALTRALIDSGHEVIILTRSTKGKRPKQGLSYAEWDPAKGTIDRVAVAGADAIVHLAGANVADGRWTDRRKQEIVDSRVQSGALLVKALKEVPNRVQAVVSSSAIGWYGPDPQQPNPRPFVETDPADDSFLGRTCVQWEDSIRPVADLGKRLVLVRTGIVLSKEGGAYAEFRKPLTFGIAPILGNGRQVISWIHIDDMVAFYIRAVVDTSFRGIYNAVAPAPVTNRELMRVMGKAKGFHIPAPVPSFVLKAMLGEMSIEVLKSATVSSARLEAAGFTFRYPRIEQAVAQLEQGA